MVPDIREQFKKQFGKKPLIAAAPGRVNLIGEHTDYNEGFVLPGAIDKRIYVAMAANGKEELNIYACQYQKKFSCSIKDIKPVKGWATYLLGMFFYLQKEGHALGGMDVLIDGDVPVGAGMSSSAAICSAFGMALNEWFGLKLDRMSLALMGQRTEHHFAGVQCGIMDEFASLHGKAGHLMKLDCRSLQYEYIPFNFPNYKIVLLNTMVSHSLSGSEYNVRRQQCEEGVSILKKYYPAILSLRDINLDQLQAHRNELSDVVYRRCLFILEENQRLLAGCSSLANGDILSFGEKMFQAHEGLSKLYEVSCEESDFMVEQAQLQKGIVGARQMGGGFGGCTINIVEDGAVNSFTENMRGTYQEKFNIVPETYTMQIEDGARIISSH